MSTRLAAGFDDVVALTRNALAEHGFGALTAIDLAAALKAEFGVDIEGYLILGACNLALAHRAISLDRETGPLLTCHVVIRADPDTPGIVNVEGMNPAMLVHLAGGLDLAGVADEITARLGAAIGSLSAG